MNRTFRNNKTITLKTQINNAKLIWNTLSKNTKYGDIFYYVTEITKNENNMNIYSKINRFINLRSYWPIFFWNIWRFLYVNYIFILLGKQSECSSVVRYRFIKKLLKDSSVMDGVDKKTFLKILNSNMDYFRAP